jgi:integrase
MAWIDGRDVKSGRHYFVKARRADRGIDTHGPYKTKTEAKAAKAELENARHKGAAVDPREGRATLRWWAEDYITHRLQTASTRNGWTVEANRYILPRLGDVRLNELHEAHFERLFRELKADGVGGPTQDKVFMILQAFLNKAVRLNKIARNPLPDRETLGLPKGGSGRQSDLRYLTADETARLIAEIDGEERLLADFMVKTGTRVGEAIETRVGDLDLGRGTVKISRSATESHGVIEVKSTKSRKARVIPLPASLRDALREHLNASGRRFDPEALVFQTVQGHQIRPSNLRNRTLAGASKRAGIAKVTPHVLRSTFASLNAHAGVDIYKVSRWLGHGSVRITEQRYVGMFQQGSEDAAAIDGILNQGVAR